MNGFRASRKSKTLKSRLMKRGKVATLYDTINDMRKKDIYDEPAGYVEQPGWKHR